MTDQRGVGVLGRIAHAANVMEAAGMGTVTVADLRAARAAVDELIEAIGRDAKKRAIDSGLGVSEWPSFIPRRIAAALSNVTASKGDASNG